MLLKELLRSVSLYRRTLPHRYLIVACIKFHNKENRPKTDGICVANHTSPIDVMVLGADNAYALVKHNTVDFDIRERYILYRKSK